MWVKIILINIFVIFTEACCHYKENFPQNNIVLPLSEKNVRSSQCYVPDHWCSDSGMLAVLLHTYSENVRLFLQCL